MTATTTTVLDQLRLRSEWQGECLVWTGPRNAKGYGNVRINGRATNVHRAAFIALHGDLPADKRFVLHRCDNPPCWRDEHLFAGSAADNMADMVAKGRDKSSKPTCANGHPREAKNTYVSPTGRSYCRPCHRSNSRSWWRRNYGASA